MRTLYGEIEIHATQCPSITTIFITTTFNTAIFNTTISITTITMTPLTRWLLTKRRRLRGVATTATEGLSLSIYAGTSILIYSCLM